MDAGDLRKAFLSFFSERGHAVAPSVSLIPHDPSVLFTIAGMVPFKPYFLGEETPPGPRLASVQRCLRTADIDAVGTSRRHLTFFEMLGNFSFGDYFKADAIPYAWDLLTGSLGMDPDRLWVTVHESDDEAEDIWRERIGLPSERIQRMGEDNFWRMGEVGPCGYSSEVYFDRGDGFGDPGGPAVGGEERYVELWNLVFMQLNRLPDGSVVDLPRRSIDTGAGLERLLVVLQDVPSPFETDAFAPLVRAAEEITGARYGEAQEADVALRILAEHARAVVFLISDGVLPSNEGRGYVLRRLIRRAVRRAFHLGVEGAVLPHLVDATVGLMGAAYPQLERDHDALLGVVRREEERFGQTLRSGLAILDEELATGSRRLDGEVVFRLHDTYGFPVDLTREIAEERGVAVDLDGFETAMEEQRQRARHAARDHGTGEGRLDSYRELLAEHGPTEFTGYVEMTSEARIVAVRDSPDPDHLLEVFLDRTPFYAEGGGQVGDTGTIVSETGRAQVVDTSAPLPGVVLHLARLGAGELMAGQEVTAAVDSDRRQAIRRNHTGTHLLHWALREVLGGHVKQQGSLVAADRLRFDFSHHAPLTDEERVKVETLVNTKVLLDEPVTAYETSRELADEAGAVAFFGDKYGEVVRVVEAGHDSVELCGGTHVDALGQIGPIRIVSESSIGANTRRIEALTGFATLDWYEHRQGILSRAADLLRTTPDEVPEALTRALEHQRASDEELRLLRSAQIRDEAGRLAATAEQGVVVARADGFDQNQLRELATTVRDTEGIRGVVLIGSPDGNRVALVAAVRRGGQLVASQLLEEAARTVGGGGGRDPVLAVAGGRDAARIDEALGLVRRQVGLAG